MCNLGGTSQQNTNQTGSQATAGGFTGSTTGNTTTGGATTGTSTSAASGDIGTLLQSLNSMLTGLGNAPSSFQAEGQDLTNRLNSANTSAVNTLAAKEGGVANPALVTRDLLSSNAQTGMQTAEGIQAQEAGQTISAEAAPLGALSSLIGGASNTTSGTTTGTQSTTQNVVNQIMQLISGSSSGTTSSNPGGLAQVGDLLGLIFG